MNAKKAFRKFGDAVMASPPGSQLTVGLSWADPNRWRVMLAVHTHALMLSPKQARGLASIYDKHHQEPEWRGKTTGLEWVASELRSLADEADQKNREGIIPDGAAEHMQPAGNALRGGH